MKLNIEVTEKDLRDLVLDFVRNKLGDVNISGESVIIEVKSKQNYRAEWESAKFRARVATNYA